MSIIPFKPRTTVQGWTGIVLYVQREKHRLDTKHHEFIDAMAAQHPVWSWEHPPSRMQCRYLHSLFLKLGGKIT
jgi:hypothetical protein